MKNTEQIIRSGLLEQFVLGLTTKEENKQIRTYIEQYPELREHLYSVRLAMDKIVSQYNIPQKKAEHPTQKHTTTNIKSWLNQLVFFMVILTILIQLTLLF